jgi:hypothetical protein
MVMSKVILSPTAKLPLICWLTAAFVMELSNPCAFTSSQPAEAKADVDSRGNPAAAIAKASALPDQRIPSPDTLTLTAHAKHRALFLCLIEAR